MSNKDWTIEQGIDEYAFVPKNAIIRIAPRFKIWATSLLSRKNLKKDFMVKNGIKNHDKVDDAILPKYYLIQHKNNDYIAKIRDSIILDKFEQYKRIQLSLLNVIKIVENKRQIAEMNLMNERSLLVEQKQKLVNAKRTKNDMNIIAYQASVAELETTIAADENRLDNIKSNLKQLKLQEEKNLKQWLKQVDFIDSTIQNLVRSYEANITKKIKNTYNFGRFETHIKDYSASAKQVISGEKY